VIIDQPAMVPGRLVALDDHFVHFGGDIVHLENSSSLAAMPNFAAQSFR
jgi:hypothetical protein